MGEHFASELIRKGAKVYGTARTKAHAQDLSDLGIEPLLISSASEVGRLLSKEKLSRISHLLDSIPLARKNDHFTPPQAEFLADLLSGLPHLRWAGYLSTTAVYGDSQGEWVDENTPASPGSDRGKARLWAESLWKEHFPAVEIFRLPGIYGPGRNILPRLLAGDYKAVRWDPPRYANRIHVADIVASLSAAVTQSSPGRIINIADDYPCPHAEYVEELCKAVGAPPPRFLTPEEAAKELSPTVLEFFRENKRVSNRKLHRELLPDLRYPSFREALPELLEEARSGR